MFKGAHIRVSYKLLHMCFCAYLCKHHPKSNLNWISLPYPAMFTVF